MSNEVAQRQTSAAFALLRWLESGIAEANGLQPGVPLPAAACLFEVAAEVTRAVASEIALLGRPLIINNN